MARSSRPARRAIGSIDRRLLQVWTGDGIADLLAGSWLLLIGATIPWGLGSEVACVGVVLLPFAWGGLRRAIVEPRIGRVAPDGPHLGWLESKMRRIVIATMALLGAVAYFIAPSASEEPVWTLLVTALALALPLGLAGLLFRERRCLAYAGGALVAAAALAVLEAPPVALVLATGALLLGSGAALLASFVRRNPLPVPAEGDA